MTAVTFGLDLRATRLIHLPLQLWPIRPSITRATRPDRKAAPLIKCSEMNTMGIPASVSMRASDTMPEPAPILFPDPADRKFQFHDA